jgi:cysteinyl-tRNA synthetase
MTLRLYNTLTRTKEDFAPLDPKNVRMYVCGPTVYDFAHIGNARPAIVFDVLFRLLRHLYGESHVTYVRNITDVDDKINARAASEYPSLQLNEAIRKVTEKTETQYRQDVAALGCLEPTFQPRATENIAEMIAMILKLIAAGHAYAAEGHVLYDVSSKKDYGKLARRSLDEMLAGARVEVAPYKKNPMDFVLWKPSKPGEPSWSSPWSQGRPGWHIECSAMSERFLCAPFHTDTFDIHGGGIDLVFPHHENEIAQSEGAHREHPLARVWMHNGFLQVEGEKMAKSLGNFVTINDLLAKEHPEVIRLQMLMTHYRQPIDWTETGRKQARAILNHWYHFTEGYYPLELSSNESSAISQALTDDLNTPEAIGLMSQTLSPMALRGAAISLGLLGSDLNSWRRWQPPGKDLDEGRIDGLIEQRNAARKAKNFKESDRIRDELLAKGIVLKDSPSGTTWEVKR